MTAHISRRRFLAASSVALAAPMFVRARNAADKLNLAVIGVADRGGANLAGVMHENIAALCDAGAAVLVVSEDLEELFELCSELVVIARGRLSPRVAVRDASPELIGQWMSGLFPEKAEAETPAVPALLHRRVQAKGFVPTHVGEVGVHLPAQSICGFPQCVGKGQIGAAAAHWRWRRPARTRSTGALIRTVCHTVLTSNLPRCCLVTTDAWRPAW